MASRTWLEPPKTLNRKPYMVVLRFFPDTANPPTFTAQDGKGVASVVRTAQGVFTITLQDSYNRLISAQATIQMAAATDIVPQFGAVSNLASATPVTVVVRTNAVATPTDIAADPANSVFVQLIFDDADS
jgi:hypothetical protein